MACDGPKQQRLLFPAEAEKLQAQLEAAAAAASKDDAEVNQLLEKLHTLEAASLGMKQQLDSQVS